MNISNSFFFFWKSFIILFFCFQWPGLFLYIRKKIKKKDLFIYLFDRARGREGAQAEGAVAAGEGEAGSSSGRELKIMT